MNTPFLYMFGMDRERPAACAEELKRRGFSAVAAPPTPAAAAACREAGLAVYGCVGAYSLREGDPEAYLGEDAFGARRPWFHSGCPNEPALWERGLARARALVRELGAEAVFLDGARFPSPAPGDELFAGCFCPRCLEKGATLGFDMEAMRRGVRDFLAVPGAPAPRDWLRFREACTREYFVAFRAEVRGAGARAGAFVFAPSLARLVGQGFVYDGSGGPAQPDILAPMLYRRYGPRPGIACLNAEYAALAGLLAGRGDPDVPGGVERLTGVRPPHADPEALRREGFAPGAVGRETRSARPAVEAGTPEQAAGAERPSSALAPIVQLADERLGDTLRAAWEAGAEGVGFFSYGRADMRFLPEM